MVRAFLLKWAEIIAVSLGVVYAFSALLSVRNCSPWKRWWLAQYSKYTREPNCLMTSMVSGGKCSPPVLFAATNFHAPENSLPGLVAACNVETKTRTSNNTRNFTQHLGKSNRMEGLARDFTRS